MLLLLNASLFTSGTTLHGTMQVVGYTLCFGLMGALAVQACVYPQVLHESYFMKLLFFRYILYQIHR